MSNPLVSVVIVINGTENDFNNSIDSIRRQSFRDFEVHIINWENYDEFKNLSTAINMGLKKSNGKYIVIMDTPDIWKPEKLEKQVDLLEQNPDIGLVYCGGRLNGYVFSKLVTRNFLQNSSAAMFRKECIDKTGLFDETLDVLGNWDFFLKLSLYYKFLSIKDPLAIYAITLEKDFDFRETFKTSGFKTLNKIFQQPNLSAKQLGLVNRAYAMRYSHIGKKYFNCNFHEKARSYFSEAFKRDFSVSFKSDTLFFYLLSQYYCCRGKNSAVQRKTQQQ